MSDEGADWRPWLEEMIQFGQEALAFTSDLDEASFNSDRRTFNATIHSIQLIGQAAAHVPEEVREAHPEINWRQIVATRNRVVHEYMGIDSEIIWGIVQNDIPDLLTALRRLLEDERG